MPFPTAAERKIPYLYHWQNFDACRLRTILRDNTVYCSKPADFNDPWDCRTFFNTELLDQPEELKKHIEFGLEMFARGGGRSDADIKKMRRLLEDRAFLEERIREHSAGMDEENLGRYRVYCLCPDVNNALLWAHYGDKHRGICLEFNVRNEVVCGALEVQYFPEFPMTRQYSKELRENLLPLLAKSDVWCYEKEFRLVAQEESSATPDDTLKTRQGMLQLPKGALRSIIVGCQGNADEVERIVRECGSDVTVKRTRKIQNRYAFELIG